MRAGRLRHRITLQQPTRTQNSMGEPVVSWSDVATVWAAVEPIKGSERLAADQLQAELDTRIVIRWSSDVSAISAAWRCVFGSVIYNIAAPPVNRGQLNKDIELMCKSGVNDGR